MLGIEDPRSLLEICKSSRKQFMLASSRELLSNDECKKKKSYSVHNLTLFYFSCLWFSAILSVFFFGAKQIMLNVTVERVSVRG